MNVSRFLARSSVFSFVCFLLIKVTTTFGETKSSTFQTFLDETIINFFLNSRIDLLSVVARDLTSLGSLTVTFVVSLSICFILSRLSKTKEALYLILVWLGCAVIPWVAKVFFNRARPAAENRMIVVHDLSFPSGHSFVAAAVFIALGFLFYRNLMNKKKSLARPILVGFILACLVGLSRMYLGVHYTTDVIGGLSLGSWWALTLGLVFQSKVFKSTN